MSNSYRATYVNPVDTARRASLRGLQQPRKSTRIIRRVLISIIMAFVFVNLLAAANPWLHPGRPATACLRSAP